MFDGVIFGRLECLRGVCLCIVDQILTCCFIKETGQWEHVAEATDSGGHQSPSLNNGDLLLHTFLNGGAENRGVRKEEAFNTLARLMKLSIMEIISAIPVFADLLDIAPGRVDAVANAVEENALWRSYQAHPLKSKEEENTKRGHDDSANKAYDARGDIETSTGEKQYKEHDGKTEAK